MVMTYDVIRAMMRGSAGRLTLESMNCISLTRAILYWREMNEKIMLRRPFLGDPFKDKDARSSSNGTVAVGADESEPSWHMIK